LTAVTARSLTEPEKLVIRNNLNI